MFSIRKSDPRVGNVPIIKLLRSFNGSAIIIPNDSILILLILVKSLPARGAIKRKIEIMMVNMTPRVIAAATLLGIENCLILMAVSLSINGLPIRESTAEIIM